MAITLALVRAIFAINSGFCPGQMKEILVNEYEKPIVKNIAERMLSYAIGRKINPYDRPAVKRICAALEENEFKMNTLIREIISSPQFKSRQD